MNGGGEKMSRKEGEVPVMEVPREAGEADCDERIGKIGGGVSTIAKRVCEDEKMLFDENLTSEEITSNHIQELADAIRLIFSNAWEEYAFCPCCDPDKEIRLSAEDVHGHDNVPLDVLNDTSYLPECSDCGTQMELFMSPEGTFKCLESKLKKDGYLSLLRDLHGKIQGLNYGYKESLENVFRKEWGKKYSYVDEGKMGGHTRSFRNFHTLISAAIIANFNDEDLPEGSLVSADMDTICLNCIAFTKNARNVGNFGRLVKNMFELLPRKYHSCISVGEVPLGTKAAALYKRAGAVFVAGVLTEETDISKLSAGDSVIVLIRPRQYMEAFGGGK